MEKIIRTKFYTSILFICFNLLGCCVNDSVDIDIKGYYEINDKFSLELPNVDLEKIEKYRSRPYIMEIKNNSCDAIYLHVTEDTLKYSPNTVHRYNKNDSLWSFGIVENFDCTLLLELPAKQDRKFLLEDMFYHNVALEFIYKKNNIEYLHKVKCNVNSNTRKIMNCKTMSIVSINQKN